MRKMGFSADEICSSRECLVNQATKVQVIENGDFYVDIDTIVVCKGRMRSPYAVQ